MKLIIEMLKMYLVLFLFSFHLCSCAVLRNRTNNEPGLYSLEDDLEILNNDNFNTTIYNSERAWLVEFYSNWCGFCKRAVPKVRAFGSDVRGWNDLVAVAVFDCANENNAPICDYFEITRYPTFRYIHEKYLEGPQNTGLPIVADSQTNFSEHRKNLIDILINEQNEGRAQRLPNLQPFNSPDFTSIFKLKESSDVAFLILQEPGDDVGPSIVMDFHKVNNVIIRYALNNDTTVINKDLPALYLIRKSGDLQLVNISSPDRQGIKIAIHELLLSKNIEVPPEILQNVTINENIMEVVNTSKAVLELERKIREAGDAVFQLDLENTLRYSLKREVGGNKEIQGEKLDALKKYLDALIKYFPFGEKGKSLLKNLQDYANSQSVIDGHEINNYLREADEPGKNIFSGPEEWLACRGSTQTLRGYPCGLWKLFHFLTINAAFDPTNTKDTNPDFVLDTMYGYIKNFFGCEDCSYHFQEMAKRRRIFNVSTWEESILWLWRAHNEVNQRLSGDVTEDPQNKKIQFPSKERCPQCYNTDDSWQEVEVLSYLKKMYSSENINGMKTNPRLLHIQNSQAAAVSSPSKGFMIVSTDLGFLLGGSLLTRTLYLLLS